MFEGRRAVSAVQGAIDRLAEPRRHTAADVRQPIHLVEWTGYTAAGEVDMLAQGLLGLCTEAGWSLTRDDYWLSIATGGFVNA